MIKRLENETVKQDLTVIRRDTTMLHKIGRENYRRKKERGDRKASY
jgi:hypothetical protein